MFCRSKRARGRRGSCRGWKSCGAEFWMLRRGSGLRWKLELGKERRAQGLQQLEGGQMLWTGSVIQDCPVFTLFEVEFHVEY